jgi:hypothetical protein
MDGDGCNDKVIKIGRICRSTYTQVKQFSYTKRKNQKMEDEGDEDGEKRKNRKRTGERGRVYGS